MLLEVFQSSELFLVLLQNGGGSFGVVENAYAMLKEGGLLMGALLVMYGQHKFYRYMIDKLEEKHRTQIEWLEGQIEEMSRSARERATQDTLMIQELTRNRSNN